MANSHTTKINCNNSQVQVQATSLCFSLGALLFTQQKLIITIRKYKYKYKYILCDFSLFFSWRSSFQVSLFLRVNSVRKGEERKRRSCQRRHLLPRLTQVNWLHQTQNSKPFDLNLISCTLGIDNLPNITEILADLGLTHRESALKKKGWFEMIWIPLELCFLLVQVSTSCFSYLHVCNVQELPRLDTCCAWRRWISTWW